MSEAQPSTTPERGTTTRRFEAEVSEVLRLVINSLYTNKEVFLRELLSNASDALDRLRFRAITEPELLPAGETLRVKLVPNEAAGTLTIWDNGVGMTAEELATNLGTVARSGSREFVRQLDEAKRGDLSLIGQFGVGFYSAYLVADRVEVTSRAAGTTTAHRWASDGRETFTIEPAERDVQGTTVTLHLKPEHKDLFAPWKLRSLVERYSDYLGYPIELETEVDGKPSVDAINTGRALWRRPAAEITREQYEEFYKHLTHDWEPPLAWRHVRLEGMQEFTALVFIPKHPPFDLFRHTTSHGVRLYVRRVFVMEQCEELLPRWLRFVRGVVDSEDLPLNVSREVLQDSRIVSTIRKQIVKHVLDLLAEIARDRPEDYESLWKSYGTVLKEGVHFDPEHNDKLSPLLRFESSRGGLVSLATYKERMAEGQAAVYYLHGPSREVVEASPHLELLSKRGLEVLYLTDPVDQWAVDSLREYDGTPLVSAAAADLKLADEAAASSESTPDGKDAPSTPDAKDRSEELAPLFERMRKKLEAHISEVRASTRLTDSPVCLVVPQGGTQPHLERLLRASGAGLPRTKRILEVNPSHPLIRELEERAKDEAHAATLETWIELLYEQALLAEGSPVEDPRALARAIVTLLTEAAKR